MSYLAFEGATKKNKPSINSGDVVYAKIVTASKDMEPELVCVDAYGKKAGLGQLTGRFPLLLVKKVDFQATEMAFCAAFLQYNNKKGFALLNFGQICSVNHQNLVISRSKTVDIVVEVSC